MNGRPALLEAGRAPRKRQSHRALLKHPEEEWCLLSSIADTRASAAARG